MFIVYFKSHHVASIIVILGVIVSKATVHGGGQLQQRLASDSFLVLPAALHQIAPWRHRRTSPFIARSVLVVQSRSDWSSEHHEFVDAVDWRSAGVQLVPEGTTSSPHVVHGNAYTVHVCGLRVGRWRCCKHIGRQVRVTPQRCSITVMTYGHYLPTADVGQLHLAAKVNLPTTLGNTGLSHAIKHSLLHCRVTNDDRLNTYFQLDPIILNKQVKNTNFSVN